MKMQSFLFRITLVLLLGNSSLLLLASKALSSDAGNCSDCPAGNGSEIGTITETETGTKTETETKTGTGGTETGGAETGGAETGGTETGGTETGGTETGTGGTETGTGGTEAGGTETGGTETGQTNTTNNGNVDDPFELLPEANSEGTETETTETAETAEETPQPTPQATSQPTAASIPGDTVSAPQVEFAAPVGEVSSPTQVAAEAAIAQLGAGTFSSSGDGAAGGAGGGSVPASTQHAVLSLLTGDPTSKSLFGDPQQNPLIRALGQGGAGQLSAWKLAESLLGLLRGGKVDSKKLLAAVAAYNALIRASNDEFLLNPPAELVAIRAVLAELVSAAEAEFRTPD